MAVGVALAALELAVLLPQRALVAYPLRQQPLVALVGRALRGRLQLFQLQMRSAAALLGRGVMLRLPLVVWAADLYSGAAAAGREVTIRQARWRAARAV